MPRVGDGEPFAAAATEYFIRERRRRKLAPQRVLVGADGLAVADCVSACREYRSLEDLLAAYELRLEDLELAA